MGLNPVRQGARALRPRWAGLCAVVALAAGAETQPAAGQSPEQGLLCREAIRAAERQNQLPADLLPAIGRVESGRRDPGSGASHPWPWTVNAEGRGRFLDTKAQAVALVRELQERGVRSIDVGCMQVNLSFHPAAFGTLEEAFDPAKNAAYAARFLVQLYERSRSWEQAAANYHSWTPHLAEAYQRRVLAAWAEESRSPARHQHLDQPRVAVAGLRGSLPGHFARAPGLLGALPVGRILPGQITGGGRVISSGGAGAVAAVAQASAIGQAHGPGLAQDALQPGLPRLSVASSSSGETGRSLDAYRAAPIPVASGGYASLASRRP